MNDTKGHILMVAFKLFLQKNFKEVTMNEIVEKTGLSKGAFYHYFKSKEKLFTELINNYYLSSWKIDYSKLNQTSLIQYFNEYLSAIELTMKKMQNIWQNEMNEDFALNYYNLIFDAMKIIPDFKDKFLEINATEYNSMKRVIENSRKSGEIKSALNDEQLTQIFLYITDGAGIRAIMSGKMDTMMLNIKNLWNSLYETIKV